MTSRSREEIYGSPNKLSLWVLSGAIWLESFLVPLRFIQQMLYTFPVAIFHKLESVIVVFSWEEVALLYLWSSDSSLNRQLRNPGKCGDVSDFAFQMSVRLTLIYEYQFNEWEGRGEKK